MPSRRSVQPRRCLSGLFAVSVNFWAGRFITPPHAEGLGRHCDSARRFHKLCGRPMLSYGQFLLGCTDGRGTISAGHVRPRTNHGGKAPTLKRRLKLGQRITELELDMQQLSSRAEVRLSRGGFTEKVTAQRQEQRDKEGWRVCREDGDVAVRGHPQRTAQPL